VTLPRTHSSTRPPAIARRWIIVGLGEVLLLAVLALLVYYRIFSDYAPYDDEGYMMVTVKHLLANHTLYDEVWTLYGPVYFFHKWLIHGLFGLPLTHDVVRLTAMTIWLSTGVVAAIVAHAVTGSVASVLSVASE